MNLQETIKRMLREETNKNKAHEGIGILIELLKKKYPFIVSWKYLNNDINDDNKFIIIYLVVSANKAKDYYNMEYKDYYNNGLRDNIIPFFDIKFAYPYPVSLFDHESYDFSAYKNHREITNFAYEMYELIPEEFKSKQKGSDIIKEIIFSSYYFVA